MNITQTIQMNVLICGQQMIDLATLTDLSEGYLKSYRMLDTDATYEQPSTIVVDLDDLFVVNEDTTYRDEYQFDTS